MSHNEELIRQHKAKVYTLASVDAPPMSVPHLDLRIIDGKEAVQFLVMIKNLLEDPARMLLDI